MELESFIRDVKDYPKPGIVFKDITPLLSNSQAFKMSVQSMINQVQACEFDAIAAIESRGFIFGAAMALELGVPFVPIRKKGKLPYKTISEAYDLEYGTDTLEVHEDAFKKNSKVLIVDDLLATGGTVQAVAKLVEKLECEVAGISFLINLTFLDGVKKLNDYSVYSVIEY